jgi:hypothetical protein
VGPFQNCVWQPRPPFKMAAVTKNRNFFSCQFLLYYKSNFNCSYMAMSSLTYFLGLFRLGILWDKNHIKIFCSEIWVEMIFGWPTFKIENQVSDYKLLGASSFILQTSLWKFPSLIFFVLIPVLEMKILIYWFESNSWIYFYTNVYISK